MNFTDTHTHLYLNQFDLDRDSVIQNSVDAGVNRILLPNINSKTTDDMMELCVKYPKICYPMIGLHPCDIHEETMEKELAHVEDMLDKYKFIGIGEIGLDMYWKKNNLIIQEQAFISQIKLAKKYKLPISIHVRNSFNEAIKIIESLNDENLSGVFHCFTGNREEAKRVINLENFYLGVGGVLTFKNSGLDKTISKIDMDYLILETDSPFLAPTPFRGKRNESQYIVHIAKKLSEVKNISLEEVSKVTTKNASNLFNLL